MKTKRYLLQHRSTFLALAMSASVCSVVIAAPALPSAESSITNEAPETQSTVADSTEISAPLSLIEVLAYALDHNPQRKSAWYAAKAAKFRIKTAKADGGLQVDLGGTASNQYGFGRVGSFIGGGSGGIGGGGGIGGSSSQGWRESLSVDATYPLYTGGRVKGNKKVASFNYQAAVARAVGTEQDLVFSTTLNYLNILRTKQLVDVNQANLDVARERYRIANVRFNAGAAAKLEVFRAETDQATAEQNVVEAENSLKQAYANLNTIMGRRPQTPMEIMPIDQLTLPQPLIANSTQLDRSTFTQGVLSRSPEQAITGSFQTGTSSTGTTLTTPRASTGNTATSPTLMIPGTSLGNTRTGNTLGTPGTRTGNTAGGINSGTLGSSTLNGTTTTNTSGNLLAGSTGLGTSTTSSQSGNQSRSTSSSTLASGQQLAQMANGSSPSLAALQAQVLAAEAAIQVAKSGKKPSIGLSLGGLISNPIGFLGRFVASIGGSLVQKLFDSGRTTSQVRDARATVEQLKSSLEYGELNVANQIEQSLLSLNSAKQREGSTGTAVASAQEALRAAQLGYSAGVQTALDVSDAEAALLTAQTNAVNAKFDVAASQAQLAAAVGILTEEGQQAYGQSASIEKVIDLNGK